MGTIRKRILMLEAVICIWLLVMISFLNEVSLNNTDGVVFLVFESAAILLLFLLVKQFRDYEDAKLIVDNTIIRIPFALMNDDNGENLEIHISCFGILLDSKVIKYNMKNISLKDIEIDNEYICINYSVKKKDRQVCILHGNISNLEQQVILKRFRYETGITPVIK
ncbi:MAG: hypothetical protein AAGU76_07105 [Sedimentibacter sp.]|uniref:hypothetical protein n=1 Tax=Sedimentibacter sp. TaxID=1960295 RepID=UPI0031585FCD